MRSTLVTLVLFLPLATLACAPEYDLVIRNGDLVDGTGSPARRADVAIKGVRIVAVGTVSGSARRTIDAGGRVVSPGFIDVQGQSGTSLLTDGNGESHIRQGITTESIGEGATPGLWTEDTHAAFRAARGYDWTGFDGYLHTLESRGTSINLGSFAPIAAISRAGPGHGIARRRRTELAREEGIPRTRDATGRLRVWATGARLPAGVVHQHRRELIAPPASHPDMAASTSRTSAAEASACEGAIGEGDRDRTKTSLPVVIYHLKIGAKANWGPHGRAFVAEIEDARAQGVDVTACQYPYTAEGTNLPAVLPGWAQEGGRDKMLERLRNPAERAKMRRDIEANTEVENLLLGATFGGVQIAALPAGKDQSILGKRLSQIAAERHQDEWETLFSILLEYDGQVSAMFHMMSEDDVRTAMRYPWVSVGTDSSAIRPDGPLGAGQPHPRSYGTFPRILGRYVRDEHVAKPEAIAR
jgi:N-acyl-D-aspartate/D-glutamate deacylase